MSEGEDIIPLMIRLYVDQNLAAGQTVEGAPAQAHYLGNVMRLKPSQLINGVLEFQKAAIAGFHTGFYLLGGLDQQLKDRARVTFTWVKD